MPTTPDEFRLRLLADVKALQDHHNQIRRIVQSMPLGETRSSLERAHQIGVELVVNLRRTLMEMA
jgi:hypothetical protein